MTGALALMMVMLGCAKAAPHPAPTATDCPPATGWEDDSDVGAQDEDCWSDALQAALSPNGEWVEGRDR